MEDKLNKFKEIVKENCKNKDFEYREWFVSDHLLIVERIAMELCDIYKEADREVVTALVWFHDFGKPIDIKNERKLTKEKGIEALRRVGLAEDFIDKVFRYWEKMEMKNEIDISQEVIEVQIVSTADGASHFVGQFYPGFFSDEPKEGIEWVREEIRKKIKVDWERKIVLPEVKKTFESRYLNALELLGEYPDKFIS
ncbi:MAG: HD domain-containing protein [Burkholderiales bacterium]|nr:HD domain-containing protein [Burkholderiales bacterium]